MWEIIIGRLLGRIPDKAVILCAMLSLLIPWSMYRINQYLHRYGDPPWKTKDKQQSE